MRNIRRTYAVALIVKHHSPRDIAAKIALLAVTLLLMASMGGGFLLLPLLTPAHIWAARRSGPVGRIGWSLLPGVSLGMVVWAAVYVTVGESKPTIWLLPIAAGVLAILAIVRSSAGASTTTLHV